MCEQTEQENSGMGQYSGRTDAAFNALNCQKKIIKPTIIREKKPLTDSPYAHNVPVVPSGNDPAYSSLFLMALG